RGAGAADRWFADLPRFVLHRPAVAVVRMAVAMAGSARAQPGQAAEERDRAVVRGPVVPAADRRIRYRRRRRAGQRVVAGAGLSDPGDRRDVPVADRAVG